MTTPPLREARQSHQDREDRGKDPNLKVRGKPLPVDKQVQAGRGSEKVLVYRQVGREVEMGGEEGRRTRRPRGSEIQELREAGSFFGGWGWIRSSQPSSRSCQGLFHKRPLFRPCALSPPHSHGPCTHPTRSGQAELFHVELTALSTQNSCTGFCGISSNARHDPLPDSSPHCPSPGHPAQCMGFSSVL